MRPLARAAATLAPLLLWASRAAACPLCDSGTGRQVRAGIFGPGFGANLLVTLLPFPVFLGVVALIHFGPPRAWGRARRAAPPDAGPERRPL